MFPKADVELSARVKGSKCTDSTCPCSDARLAGCTKHFPKSVYWGVSTKEQQDDQ